MAGPFLVRQSSKSSSRSVSRSRPLSCIKRPKRKKNQPPSPRLIPLSRMSGSHTRPCGEGSDDLPGIWNSENHWRNVTKSTDPHQYFQLIYLMILILHLLHSLTLGLLALDSFPFAYLLSSVSTNSTSSHGFRSPHCICVPAMRISSSCPWIPKHCT